MKITKTETITKKVTTIAEVTCDICKKINKYRDEVDWDDGTEDNYHEDIISIYRKTGVYYPEYQNWNKLTIHVCPDCFENVILATVKECNPDFIPTKEENWDG